MMQNSPYNYSVIIPHHDIPDLLERCLRSIPVREDVQVIVVDDASAPEHQDRLHQLELAFPGAEFIYSPSNRGAGAARNIGLEHATGKWLIFADADDFFAENFGEILDEYIHEPADIVYFYNRCVESEDVALSSTAATEYNNFITLAIETGQDTPLRYRHWVPWGKLIKRNLVSSNNLQFEEIPYSNDIVFSASAGCLARKIIADDRYLYCYCSRHSSLSNEMNSKPGELQVRAKACFRYQKAVHEFGYTITGRYPISDFLIPLYHQDKQLFDDLFLRLQEIGCSPWDILRQMRGWEKGYVNKLRLYLYALPRYYRSVRNG